MAVRVQQLSREVLLTDGSVKTGQVAREVLYAAGAVLVSQVVREVLISSTNLPASSGRRRATSFM